MKVNEKVIFSFENISNGILGKASIDNDEDSRTYKKAFWEYEINMEKEIWEWVKSFIFE